MVVVDTEMVASQHGSGSSYFSVFRRESVVVKYATS
jgi:hypothetical protein